MGNRTQFERILYTGQACVDNDLGIGKVCYDETYLTQNAFETAPVKMLDHTSRCMWAHSTKQFGATVHEQMVFCIAFEKPSADSPTSGTGMRSLRESRLFSSNDFFKTETRLVDFGIGKNARGLVGIGSVQGFIFVALKPVSDTTSNTGANGGDEMLLYVTSDTQRWERAKFPHGHGLKENAYTIVESTKHSILVDVLTDPAATSGTLFTSDSSGTQFVRSLEHTNRNTAGIVDFESLENIEGVAIANVLSNPEEVEGKQEEKRLQTRITFDDGGHWQSIRAPERDSKGNKVKCDTDITVGFLCRP